MKLYFIKIILVFLPLFALSGDTWKVKSSSVTFKIKNAGLTVDGSFSGLTADIKFNPLKPEEASIKASISAKSINTGTDMRDNHLRKPEYFDVEKFPSIALQSVKIGKTGPITFNGTFKLTIKGITKEITFPFTFIKIPEKTEFKGNFTINRRDYGVGGSSITMADELTVFVTVQVE